MLDAGSDAQIMLDGCHSDCMKTVVSFYAHNGLMSTFPIPIMMRSEERQYHVRCRLIRQPSILLHTLILSTSCTPHLRGLSSLLRLRTSELNRVILLRRLLALADRGRALDGEAAQVGAVVAAGGLVDDLAVVAAGGGFGAEGRGLDAAGGLVGLVRLLGQEGHAAVGAGDDADGLWRVCELCYRDIVGVRMMYLVVDVAILLWQTLVHADSSATHVFMSRTLRECLPDKFNRSVENSTPPPVRRLTVNALRFSVIVLQSAAVPHQFGQYFCSKTYW